MWIKNSNTRTIGKNKSQEESYLVVNLLDKNPAIRVSEKARRELRWDKNDYVNVYVDHNKIMLIKDNLSREFPVRIYKNKDKAYGFNIYGMPIKEIMKKFGWETQKDFPVQILGEGDKMYLVAFKDELSSMTELAHLKVRNL
jgi:hypothetical protein